MAEPELNLTLPDFEFCSPSDLVHCFIRHTKFVIPQCLSKIPGVLSITNMYLPLWKYIPSDSTQYGDCPKFLSYR